MLFCVKSLCRRLIFLYNKKEMSKTDRSEYARAYYEANRERLRVYYQEYQARNRGHLKELGRKWREKNPNYQREWAKRNPGKVQEYNERQRRRMGMTPRTRQTPEERRARRRAWDRRLWGEVIAAYGAKCACCGEAELRFLTIDHINGERPEFPDLKPAKGKKRSSTNALYRWLKRKGWPKGFQCLCWNCNQSTRWGEKCPHTGSSGPPEPLKAVTSPLRSR